MFTRHKGPPTSAPHPGYVCSSGLATALGRRRVVCQSWAFSLRLRPWSVWLWSLSPWHKSKADGTLWSTTCLIRSIPLLPFPLTLSSPLCLDAFPFCPLLSYRQDTGSVIIHQNGTRLALKFKHYCKIHVRLLNNNSGYSCVVTNRIGSFCFPFVLRMTIPEPA